MTQRILSNNTFLFNLNSFYKLMKPRVMSLVIFTCVVGLIAAPAQVDFITSTLSLCAVALGAGAAGALNMWYESDLDALMKRTCLRPIPTGKISKNHALIFGLTTSFISVIALYYVSNFLSAVMLTITILFYVVIYTMWLKKLTPQNIVIGGAAGAAPPVLGWTAVSGTQGIEYSLLLFLIVFIWTPPHFWALAIFRVNEYKKVSIPMLPVTHGIAHTKKQILFYTILLFIVTLMPYLYGMSGLIYLVSAVLLSGGFLVYAIIIIKGGENKLFYWKTFKYSINYLMLIFIALLVDHYWLFSL